MRTIKFRAWNKTLEKWVKPRVDLVPHMSSDNYKSMYLEPIDAGEWDAPLLDVELYQFTGFLDCKGVEIYEGDIVKYKDNEFDVIWCNAGFKLMERKSMFEMNLGDGWFSDVLKICQCGGDRILDDFEVIGNMYEFEPLTPTAKEGTQT